MNVEVYHNVAQDQNGRPLGMMDGYHPNHPIVKVAQFQYSETLSDYVAAEKAYEVFNVGDDPTFVDPKSSDAELAREYRARGNRSLSVGDVVSVDGRWLIVDHVGFSRIIDRPKVVVRTERGTTPLHVTTE